MGRDARTKHRQEIISNYGFVLFISVIYLGSSERRQRRQRFIALLTNRMVRARTIDLKATAPNSDILQRIRNWILNGLIRVELKYLVRSCVLTSHV